MESWMTAAEIAGRYLVGEARLLSYADRGNLPRRRLADGTTLFDERVVARFFKAKRGVITSMKIPEGPHMGVLGVAKLGDRTDRAMPPASMTLELDPREARRRALRLATPRETIAEPQKRIAG
jgi:hypothetical protein